MKLVNVPQFVQEQFRIEPRVRRQEHRAPQRDGGDAGLSERPPADARGEPATPESSVGQLRIPRQHRVRESLRTTE